MVEIQRVRILKKHDQSKFHNGVVIRKFVRVCEPLNDVTRTTYNPRVLELKKFESYAQ